MTHTGLSTDTSLDRMRRYRRLFWGCFTIGVLGFLAGDFLGYPIVGVGIYWAGVIGMLVIWKGTSFHVFDEREQTLDRRASHLTLTVVGLALIVGAPGQVVFSELGYQLPLIVEGALWGYALQFVVFALAYVVVRFRG